jgi:hypothetical protein
MEAQLTRTSAFSLPTPLILSTYYTTHDVVLLFKLSDEGRLHCLGPGRYCIRRHIASPSHMHLLRIIGSRNFSLATFYKDDIPPYAILSHTWGLDGDEVSYEDLRHGSNISSKPGFEKLNFCIGQAQRDGLQYCWVDTCCINKQSDQELTEAINSMFRWYQRAAKCYVFLTDHIASGGWQHFGQSRWFTRGWTLQELLAPQQVDFYDAYGHYLGNKTTLASWINHITRIPPSALSGDQPLQTFSVQDRLSWATHRKTKREEDGAYSLLGIFGCSMPLIYGEGKKNAYYRLLQEVESSGGREINARYINFLPSDDPPSLEPQPGMSSSPKQNSREGKAKQSSSQPDPSTSVSSSHAPEGDKETKQMWDAERQHWIQRRWNPEIKMFYRIQYAEGMSAFCGLQTRWY